jgi:hypothetical protein
MNKKHKLLHRDNEYITSKLEIIYEEDIQRIVEEKNNLQSKIDKAIDKINQYELIVGYYDSNYDEYDDTYSHEIKDELLDILKEDK